MNKKGQRFFGLGHIIGGIIAIAIMVSIYPFLIESLDTAVGSSNNVTNLGISESANTILGLEQA